MGMARSINNVDEKKRSKQKYVENAFMIVEIEMLSRSCNYIQIYLLF